jgi:hypothetical protein
MEARLIVAAVVFLVALAAARLLERRRREPPIRDSYPVPAQLDRADFPRPEAPWLVALFSSRTCDTCGPMALKVAALAADDVATCDIEVSEGRELHRRYRIEGVPMVVLADAEGVVRAGFVGTVSSEELIAALTAAREDGIR